MPSNPDALRELRCRLTGAVWRGKRARQIRRRGESRCGGRDVRGLKHAKVLDIDLDVAQEAKVAQPEASSQREEELHEPGPTHGQEKAARKRAIDEEESPVEHGEQRGANCN